MKASRPDTTMAANTTTFSDLPLHRDIGHALKEMRFLRPSPIQLHALPVALFGNDVIGQAKSGTGKTAVFGITAIEHAIRHVEQRRCRREKIVVGDPLALILAPTREIAVQIECVLRQLARFQPEIIIRTCIGGLPMAQDQIHLATGCHIVVGTPGRVMALMEQCLLPCSAIRLLILDEVDKLMAQDFEKDIRYIANAIPERRQTLAFSATFTPDQLVALVLVMRAPQIVRVQGPQEVTTEFISSSEDLASWETREQSKTPELWLRQVRQFYSVIKPLTSSHAGGDTFNMKAKVVKLVAILSEIVFAQCMVFCNDKFRAEALATALSRQGWPAACITGSQPQTTRMEVMEEFRKTHSRVLVSTDLTARGIDVDKVNFVVNLDLPRDPVTYLHRVGRTGRFGRKGLAVTLLSHDEVQGIHLLGRVFKMEISELPTPIPTEIYTYAAENADDSDEAEQFVPCVVTETLFTNERSVQSSSDKLERKVETAIEDENVVNKSLPRGCVNPYEQEEHAYEYWVKLL
ncbi:unnamed protein product [Peronospora belbahrii]|uniref:RNA helicase n=1 Tax=Peronospora belbahrii TaxID=622444 RepID=A0ABN8D645_9STRA|nr:unnamed protein product [Peronospora belbahrii]